MKDSNIHNEKGIDTVQILGKIKLRHSGYNQEDNVFEKNKKPLIEEIFPCTIQIYPNDIFSLHWTFDTSDDWAFKTQNIFDINYLGDIICFVSNTDEEIKFEDGEVAMRSNSVLFRANKEILINGSMYMVEVNSNKKQIHSFDFMFMCTGKNLNRFYWESERCWKL